MEQIDDDDHCEGGDLYGEFNDLEEEDAEKFKKHVLIRKLESFDIILDDINLELSEFLEEMAN